MITSKNNAQLKKVRRLMESAKARRDDGCFVAEGLRLVREVPKELLVNVYISESAAKSIEEIKAACEIVADDVFRSISDTVSPQGVLAVVRKPAWKWADMEAADQYILLDDVRDPGNMGTIIRTAEAAGAAVITSPGCADIYNPKVIRSTMGSIFRVPFMICDLNAAIDWLHEKGCIVYAAALDGATDYSMVNYGRQRAFVIGNEANGISEEILKAADERVFIPMKGKVESLNAAVSAAVLMYGR